jgi:hypothetical protein
MGLQKDRISLLQYCKKGIATHTTTKMTKEILSQSEIVSEDINSRVEV